MTKFAVVAILLALMMPARADRANIMLAKCMGALGDAGRWHCIGVLEGIVYTGNFAKPFCSPPDMELHYMAILVKAYIETRPQRMNEDFGKLALEVLTAAWPCQLPIPVPKRPRTEDK
jgi:hypothetical protein